MISASELQALRTDGAIRLRKPFDDHWIETLRQGIDRNMRDPSPLFRGELGTEDSKGYLFDMWTRHLTPEFDDFVRNSGVAEIAAECLGEDQVRLVVDAWFSKPAGTVEHTPWHQDVGILGTYYSFWVALDPVPKSESLELIRGSHLTDTCYMFKQYFETEAGGKTLRAMEEEAQAYHLRGGSQSDRAGRLKFEPVPDIDNRREDFDILSWEVETGDCIIFHGMMLHGSAGNPSQADARRFITRWSETSAVVGPHGDTLKGAVQLTGYDVPLKLGETFSGEHMFPLLPEKAA